jgi:hypothetical protein
VGVAVGQDEAAHPLGVERGEDLADPATAVVADYVGLGDAQGVEELAQHDGVRGYRYVLPGLDLGVAVREQVDGDAAPGAG